MGGELTRMWISFAPARFNMRISFRLVVPRTMESSTRTTRLPLSASTTAAYFMRAPKSRMDCLGSIKVRPFIVASDEAHLKRQFGLLGVAHGGHRRGIRHGHNDIGLGRGFPGQLAAQFSTDFIDAFSKDMAVGPGKIDEFKNAMGLGGRGHLGDGPHPAMIEGHDFPRFDFPREFRVDDVKGAGLRRDQRRPVQSSDMERPHPQGSRAAKIILGV
jgi:hypothetical protein